MRRPRRRALAVRGPGCLAPSAQAAGGQQSHRFLCAPAQPDGLRLPATPYSAAGTCGIFDHARGRPPGVARARRLPRGVEVVVFAFCVDTAAPCAISPFLQSKTSSRAEIRPLDGCSARGRALDTAGTACNICSYVDGDYAIFASPKPVDWLSLYHISAWPVREQR